MSQYALRIPDSLAGYAKELAREDNVSLNQFIVLALAEKVSALKTETFFEGPYASSFFYKKGIALILAHPFKQLLLSFENVYDLFYSTVTDFAKFLGLSGSQFFITAR